MSKWDESQLGVLLLMECPSSRIALATVTPDDVLHVSIWMALGDSVKRTLVHWHTLSTRHVTGAYSLLLELCATNSARIREDHSARFRIVGPIQCVQIG